MTSKMPAKTKAVKRVKKHKTSPPTKPDTPVAAPRDYQREAAGLVRVARIAAMIGRDLETEAREVYRTRGREAAAEFLHQWMQAVLNNAEPPPAPPIPAPDNKYLVGRAGDYVVIGLPMRTARMSPDDALAFAAWIVAVSGDRKRFLEILAAVENT